MKGAVQVLKEQLYKKALGYGNVPADYRLVIEDVREEGAFYFWSSQEGQLGAVVELNPEGRLVQLHRPSTPLAEGQSMDVNQQRERAEAFLWGEHPEAQPHLQFTYFVEQTYSTKFYYKQYAQDIPLKGTTTLVEVHISGAITRFNYNGFSLQVPMIPVGIWSKEAILKNVLALPNWDLKLYYLDHDQDQVGQDGFYWVYTNKSLAKRHNAMTGATLSMVFDEEEKPKLHPIVQSRKELKADSLEKMIGLTEDMVFEEEVDQGPYLGLIWRGKDWQKAQEQSLDGFVKNKVENTLKAVISKTDRRLQSFVWYKERKGNKQLTYKECKEIGNQFLVDYYTDYIPYVYELVDEMDGMMGDKVPCRYPLHDGEGTCVEGEHFSMAINRTTGLVDLFMAPSHTVEDLKAINHQPLLPITDMKKVMERIETSLEWDLERDENGNQRERLIYYIHGGDLECPIRGINAQTGALILRKI